MNNPESVQKDFPFDFDTSLMTADRYKSVEMHPLAFFQKPMFFPPKIDIPSTTTEKNITENQNKSERLVFKNRPQTRLQSFVNFFRKKSQSRHPSESNSAEKQDKKGSLKYSSKATRSKNFLYIVFFVKKFVEIIKSYDLRQKIMRLTEYHYQIINDKAFVFNANGEKAGEKITITKPFHELWERTKRNRQIMRNVKRIKGFFLHLSNLIKGVLDRNFKVFSPEHNMRIFWDFVVLFTLIINIFYIPLDITFGLEPTYLSYDINNLCFNIIPNGFFMIDMFINMNTAYYSKGEYVQKRKKILKNYLRHQFSLDLLTIGPVVLHWVASEIHWFREIDSFAIFRLFKIKLLIFKMDEYLHLESKAQGLFNLLKLLFINLFVAHICGCVFNYIGDLQVERFEQDNWLVQNDLLLAPPVTRYIACCYWSVTTMITVGYGDIIAVTDVERLFAIIVMLMSCGVFAYSLNSMGSIFQEMYKKENEFRAKLVDISYYMNKRSIHKTLQSKIKRYLEYMHEEEMYGYQRGTDLINGLSNKLQDELCEELYGKILKELRIFKDNRFSQQFLKKIALKVQEITFAPGDIIFLEREEDESRLYFIMRGEIELFMRSQGNKGNDGLFPNLKKLKTGEYFGEYGFFSGKQREIAAKSTHVSNLCYINLVDFLEISKDFPEDFQRYSMIRDRLLIYNDLSVLKNKCPSCAKPANHLIAKCSLFSYNPNPDTIIHKYMNRNHQKREIFTRNIIRMKFNSLQIKCQILKNQRIFAERNPDKLSPKNKGRRANVYDIQSFLNNNNSGPLRHSNSIPFSIEENNDLNESFDESEVEDAENSPKASFIRTQSFYSSKDSPNHSSIVSRLENSENIVSKMRKFQQVDPLQSLISLSKSSNPQIQQEQLDRIIINEGLPKTREQSHTPSNRDARSPNNRRTILKKTNLKKEPSFSLRKASDSERNPMTGSLKKKTNFQLKKDKSLEFGALSKEKSVENFTSMASLQNVNRGRSIENIQLNGMMKDSFQGCGNKKLENSLSESSDEEQQPITNFDKVKNFTIYFPQNNVETLILQGNARKASNFSPKKKRKAELMLKFKQVVNTVKNSKKNDFSKRNGSFIKGFKKYYINSDDFEAQNANIKGKLKLEKVPIENEIEGKIGLTNIVEEENEWVSHERGSFMQPLERSILGLKDSVSK